MEDRAGGGYRLVRLLFGELVLFGIFYFSTPILGTVPATHFATWLHQSEPKNAFTALVRLGGLAVSSWLLFTTVAYALAKLAGIRSLVRGSRRATLPYIRRIVDGVAAASLLAATVAASAGIASASQMSQPDQIRVLRPPLPHRDGRDAPVKPPALASTAQVNRQVVGRHLPHPGLIRHKAPTPPPATPNPTAPSQANGFAGLAPGTKVVVVQPGDCLSLLAQRRLGSWQRYHEIAALNMGRPQADGRSLQQEHWIYQDWALVMPTDAVGTFVVGDPVSTPAPAPAAAATSQVTPAPPAGRLPDRPAESGRAGPSPTGLPPNRVSTSAKAHPESVKPPDVGNGPGTASVVNGSNIVGSATAPVSLASPGDGPTMARLPPDPSPPVLLKMTAGHDRRSLNGANLLLDAGLVGASVLGVVRLRRQRQAQHRPSGRRIRLPGSALARSELALRSGETPGRVGLVVAAVDLLASTLAEDLTPPPTVLGVLVDDDVIEVLLARPAAAPEPWSTSAEGFRWRIAARSVPPVVSARSAPLPALVAFGRAATGEADVLINLEAAGIVRIRGQASSAAGLLHGMATHLSGAPWAAAVDLVLVGFPPGLIQHDRARTVPSLTAMHEELRATAEIMTAAVSGHGCADAFHGRVRGLAGDGWPPVVVLCAQPPTAEEVGWIQQLTTRGSGIVAVVIDAIANGLSSPASWIVDVDARPMPIDPLRLAVKPTVLDSAAADAIAELLMIAQDDSGATLDDPPYDRIDLSVEREETPPAPGRPTETIAAIESGMKARGSDAAPPERSRPPVRNASESALPDIGDPPILVRVLGTIEIDGAIEFKRAKGRELVVYLAMHPNGVGEAELDEALWPSRESRTVAASTRDSTVSVARSAIGGPARLLPAQGQGREKRYQLSRDVQSDWSRFCTLHRWGRNRRSLAALRAALELVRGRPFEGVVSGRTYGWIHTEGHGRHIEAEAADAADLAAELFFEANDPLGARWAARQGLRADPYGERLWVRLMDAAHQLGESQEIERLMDEMDVVLELGGDFSGLHPNTLAAYDRLSRRRRFPA